MKHLDNQFTYKGFIYNQEWRNETFAIYSQWLKGKLIAYESVKIRVNKACERFGKYFEAAESYPNDKEWGINGFTSITFNEAKKILLKHFPKIKNLYSPNAVEARTSHEPYQNTSSNKLSKFYGRIEYDKAINTD